jgi:hypothetical protein
MKGRKRSDELKPEQFNKPYYLSINRTRGLARTSSTVHGSRLRGRVQKIGPAQMIAKNTRYGAKAGTPLELAAEQSFTDSLLDPPRREAPHPDRSRC